MMKAVLVFCEGRADAVFVQRSLEAISQCVRYRGRLMKLPTPFGTSEVSGRGIVATQLYRDISTLDDLKLREAATPPNFHFDVALRDDERKIWYFLVVMGGEGNWRNVVNLIEGVCESMKISDDFEISSVAWAIVCDANDVGRDGKLNWLRGKYSECFGDLSMLVHAGWVETSKHPIGAFVFFHGKEMKGSLEDHVVQIVSRVWENRYSSAQVFIDSNMANGDAVKAKKAARLKAIITSAGQFDFPGTSLSRIIGDGHEGKKIPLDEFERLPVCRELVDFLQRMPWI